MADKLKGTGFESVFVTRSGGSSASDPRTFTHGDQSYQVALDEHGNPNGVSFFAGASPTFLSTARIKGMASEDFLKAATDAASRAMRAVKEKTLVRKEVKGRERWVLAS